MNSLTKIDVIKKDNYLVVDSRLIAQELGIQHESFIKTIKKYLTEIEEFGHLRFEVGTVTNSVGARNTTISCYLNEEQATYVMTLSKNTDKVRQCKRALVKAFSQAKEVIKTVIPQQSEQIRELELQNEILNKQLALRQLDNSMLTLHGKETVLALRGISDQIIKSEVLATEVVQPKTGKVDKILTADQLKQEIKKRTGQKVRSLKWFTDKLRQANRDDLLVPVTRHSTNEYIAPDSLDEAIDIVFGSSRQILLGE